MRETILGNHIRKVPSVAVGCMRLSEKSKNEMNHFIHAALEQGAYFFDHADIYGGGMSESVFGEAIADDPSIKREDIYLQSKCGIRQGFYDLSKEHILKSVDGILKRLHTDYLDLLLLHRPDALVEPEEVAAAFDDLFEKYLSSCEVVAVKTSNMGSLYKLTYHVTLKDNAEEKTFLDELRCRNGNLEISMMRQEANVNEL